MATTACWNNPCGRFRASSRTLIREWEVDDYEYFVTYFNAEWWIELREDYGRVESLDMGVRFKNEDEYDWPAAVPAAISDSLTQTVPPPTGTGYA